MRHNFTDFCGFSGSYALATGAEGGRVLLDDAPLPQGTTRAELFIGNPVTLEAIADDGLTFQGCSDGESAAVRSISATADLTLTAEFQ